MRRFGLRGIAIFYLVAVLLGPLAMVFYRAFEHGVHPLWSSLTDPNTIHAFTLTLEITAIAVISRVSVNAWIVFWSVSDDHSA